MNVDDVMSCRHQSRPIAGRLGRHVIALAAALSSLALTITSPAADEFARGKELAERLCAECHLNPGQGDKTGPGTVPGFAAVARRPTQTLEGIIAWLHAVPPMMPNHHLSHDEIEALAFYILSLRDSGNTGALQSPASD